MFHPWPTILRLTPPSLFPSNCVPWVRNCARPMVESRGYGSERQIKATKAWCCARPPVEGTWHGRRAGRKKEECRTAQLRNADWERRNRAIADCGRCGRPGEASGRFGVRVGNRAVRGRVRSRNGPLNAKSFAYVRLCSRIFAYWEKKCQGRCVRPRRIATGLGRISGPSVSHGSTQFFHLWHL